MNQRICPKCGTSVLAPYDGGWCGDCGAAVHGIALRGDVLVDVAPWATSCPCFDCRVLADRFYLRRVEETGRAAGALVMVLAGEARERGIPFSRDNSAAVDAFALFLARPLAARVVS